MNTLPRRILIGLLFALGVARAVAYFAYAAHALPLPIEAFHLEAKMVLLAERVVLGETLYPAWREYPHVADFFGPIYFGSVGLIGRAAGADIPALFLIGRAVTVATGLIASAVVAVAAGRRYGRAAGLLAGIATIGSAPMAGYSVMVRPDVAAEMFGVAGFFLSRRRSAPGLVAAGVLLACAVLTKQTTAVFLLAAGLGLAAEGDWRRALALLGGTAALLAAVVGVVTASVEPRFASCLMGESRTPWEASSLASTLSQVWMHAPDLLVFGVAGLVAWASGATGRREPALAVLAAVLLASSVGLSAKRGAALNYYLSLRILEGLAAAALWQSARVAGTRLRAAGLAAALLLASCSMVPGLLFMVLQADHAVATWEFLGAPPGMQMLGTYRALFRMASAPGARLLTDSGLIDLYHRDRAVFGDPWLLHMLAETGQLDLTVLRERADSGYYDLVVTTSPIEEPFYADYDFGLPMPVVERLRARYARVGVRDTLFFYRRRPSG
ncbi:hypothetical protein OJF2_00540 [Aquisphaera giovannonii]|uniref:Glycosyltransferase RgtA/B/C/D-like domain-containing protein n=1 Tax=Aquisphaera giovannonii TaxID=406548 RepID=A0A5B9VU43_9BACT|nr:hypothetical protein OJF2_00540 [Aquisphaera giovannonii]